MPLFWMFTSVEFLVSLIFLITKIETIDVRSGNTNITARARIQRSITNKFPVLSLIAREVFSHTHIYLSTQQQYSTMIIRFQHELPHSSTLPPTIHMLRKNSQLLTQFFKRMFGTAFVRISFVPA
ncbi:conserved hypothetical protein [Trichinella spiralis]|uniref:hypothetical protein n=1 Tax=Trichinella spiralis TaxID=6334 RepID=UPI0001EFD703|nr:conserved hypothetical protein [Trichinella spiralis]